MLNRKVVVVGVGAIGCQVAKLLSETVKNITVIDRDFVDADNLPRQKLYSSKDVGKPKAVAAKQYLPKIKAVVADLDYKNAGILDSDLVLDCTDNFETRFLINDYCKSKNIPWIYAAVIKDMGTVYTVSSKSACFRCIFDKHASLETCDTVGVTSNAITATAEMQVQQALNLLQRKKVSSDMIRIYPNSILKLKVNKNKGCSSCNGDFEYLTGRKMSKVVKLCGTSTYQIKGKPIKLRLLLKKFRNSDVKNFRYCLYSRKITLFKDGRAIVKASSPEKAKSIYSRFVG